LLPGFRCITEQKAGALSTTVQVVVETWRNEKLDNPPPWATGAENNSSIVLLLQLADRKLLLAADAGVEALEKAVANAASMGIDLAEAYFVQVPHHGSRRNVGADVLNKQLGPVVTQGLNGKTAFVSTAVDGAPKHPSKRVVNAFLRRGAKVISTQGQSICHRHNTPARQGWGPVQSPGFEPFYTEE
jgi:beta-lactamase superfamily II metal-dependent hydrolase